MKRKTVTVLGNTLMGFGLVTMIVGVGYAIYTQAAGNNLPQFFTYSAIMSIFIGALLWLVGARVSGHEEVADRYWWVKRFDKRCRHNQRHP